MAPLARYFIGFASMKVAVTGPTGEAMENLFASEWSAPLGQRFNSVTLLHSHCVSWREQYSAQFLKSPRSMALPIAA